MVLIVSTERRNPGIRYCLERTMLKHKVRAQCQAFLPSGRASGRETGQATFSSHSPVSSCGPACQLTPALLTLPGKSIYSESNSSCALRPPFSFQEARLKTSEILSPLLRTRFLKCLQGLLPRMGRLPPDSFGSLDHRGPSLHISLISLGLR